ncbi:bifunctional phosphopantothenoylcysteine decarboxylase/phosphopantothenate--cysteine ligase CoaBC [Oenococcus oeni]|uniref:bifunctional phosphopantothenoylcysteine decarboxylase/phosphopantothenate--cysteine ligase CoaBC n=1 Tax=Oenococcus oeni TaxID=1247 RepID=UPI0010B42D9A|nr:bifunctional phosphopantothenoylcysteine decarboxylase/phosphopantothenate--cysteine ligase CoaBC [Oenococcus oeni]SYW15396.1 coenzyme A biosynthesis bifunctional protein CoaBC [Oenococcus oeni]
MIFFKNKHILVVVTGGIAAYKSAILVRSLIKKGGNVRVAMTKSAENFVTPLTFSTLTKHTVLTDIFKANDGSVDHVAWARWADFIFVVPATANFIAKMAHGIADDTASTLLLASPAEKVIAPSMNDQMWNNPATVRNIKQLDTDGILIIEPTTGFLAEGYDGKGRLPESDDILEQAQIRLLAKNGKLKNKNVLITAGGTKEALDPLRYITNRSSGKMGYALAQAAVEAGAVVTLISTVERRLPFGSKLIKVTDAREMLDTVLEHFDKTDIFISAAAVSDFRPAKQSNQKIKKTGNQGLKVELVQNPDILATVGAKKTGQFVVGFAAETENIVEYAKNKLVKKHADMIVANEVGHPDSGFNVDNNRVIIFRPKQAQKEFPLQSKIDTARSIIEEIIKSVFE